MRICRLLLSARYSYLSWIDKWAYHYSLFLKSWEKGSEWGHSVFLRMGLEAQQTMISCKIVYGHETSKYFFM